MTTQTAKHEFRVAEDVSRLDQYLAGQDTGLNRSQLRRLIVEGQVLVKQERMPDGSLKLILKDKETGRITSRVTE